jgi:hypothetical protein
MAHILVMECRLLALHVISRRSTKSVDCGAKRTFSKPRYKIGFKSTRSKTAAPDRLSASREIPRRRRTAARKRARAHHLDMAARGQDFLKRSRETKRWTSLWIREAERRAQHPSTAHQKEGPDRAWKTRTGDAQAAFPCHCSDVLAMREKS